MTCADSADGRHTSQERLDMYDVLVYDKELGQFRPVSKWGYKTWNEAASAMVNFSMENPDEQYKVEYRRMRRRRRAN